MISDNSKHFDWSLNRENYLIHLHGEFNDWLDIEQLWNNSLIKFQRSIGYCQRMLFITHEYFELLFFFPMIFWNIFFILLMSPENLECKGLCISSFGNSKITSIRTFPWEETWWKLRKSCITLIHKFLQEGRIEVIQLKLKNWNYSHKYCQSPILTSSGPGSSLLYFVIDSTNCKMTSSVTSRSSPCFGSKGIITSSIVLYIPHWVFWKRKWN